MREARNVSGCLAVIVFLMVLFFFAGRSGRHLEIDPHVDSVMQDLGYSECYLVRLGKWEMPDIKNEDKADELAGLYIDNVLESYIEKIPITDRDDVENGDYIVVSYKIYEKGNLISEAEDEVIHVGEGKYDPQFEESIIGAKINEDYQMDWIVPDDPSIYRSYEDLVGKEVQVLAHVEELYQINRPELTDEFAQEKLGYDSAEDYKKDILDKMRDEQNERNIKEFKTALIESIVKDSEFQLNEDAVIENAISIYDRYEEESYIYDISVEEYLKNILGMDVRDIYDGIYEDSQDDIKWYLVIGGLAVRENIGVNADEIEKYLSEYGQSYEKLSEKEHSYIYFNLIEEKVLERVYEECMEQAND